jgi:thymidylate synthase
MKFDLSDNKIPLLTTKSMFWKGIVHELLFFLKGRVNTKQLSDNGVRIWEPNTTREFLDKRGLQDIEEYSLGEGYGF